MEPNKKLTPEQIKKLKDTKNKEVDNKKLILK